MTHHSSPQKQSSTKGATPSANWLATRPFAPQPHTGDAEPVSESQQRDSTPLEFSSLEPGGGRSLPAQPKLTRSAADNPAYPPPQTTPLPQPILQRRSTPIPPITQPAVSSGSLNNAPLNLGDAIQRDLVDADAAATIDSLDVAYELIAHRLAYNGVTGAEEWLDNQGYERSWRNTVTGLGLFVGLLMPKKGSSKLPVLAFKGTEPSKLGDVLADIDPVAVGFAAFKMNQTEVAALIAEAGGKVDVVGHSLGGGLAQQAASAFPGKIRKVVTFQAPGITQEQVRQFNALPANERPQVSHHIATGDVVDLAGGKHLGGSGIYTGQGNANFFLHHISQQGRLNISSHTQYLLQDDQFAKQKQTAGIDDALHQQLGVADKIGQHRQGVEQYDDNPFWFRQFTAERAREFAAPGGALAIGGAALALRGRQNFKAGGIGNKALGAAQMLGGGAAGLAGATGALAGGLVGGAVGLVGGGLGYAGQGAIAGGKAIARGAKAAGSAIGQGATAVGGAIARGGRAVGRGAAALAHMAMSFLPGRSQGNAVPPTE